MAVDDLVGGRGDDGAWLMICAARRLLVKETSWDGTPPGDRRDGLQGRRSLRCGAVEEELGGRAVRMECVKFVG